MRVRLRIRAFGTLIGVVAAGLGAVRPVCSQSMERSLAPGDFVRGTLDQRGQSIRIRGFHPDGTKIRAFGGPDSGTKTFRFVAEAAGAYRLELTAAPSDTQGSYRLEVVEIAPMAERLKIKTEERYRSPRIDELQSELAAGRRAALTDFWRELAAETTPIAEPLPGDEDHLLVTFVWKATFETHNVVVACLDYWQHLDDFRMTRLGDTDLWYKTMRLRKGARFWYQLSPNDTLSAGANAQRYATAQVDPLNPRRRPEDPNVTRHEVFSLAELPGAPPQPWIEPRAEVPKGSLADHVLESDTLGGQRRVSVYLPSGYDSSAAAPYPVVVLFDRGSVLNLGRVPTTLDNLIAARKLRPVVALFIGNPGDDGRRRELTCNPAHADFLHEEALPWLRARFHVTRDPREVVVGGVSHGGLAATCAAMRHPESFGNVLSQSGTFWFVPGVDPDEIALRTGDRENNWVARQFIERPRLAVRFFLEAGLFENDVYGSGGQILETTRHLRDVLRAKGYEVEYRDFAGGHDWVNWRGSIADGLMALIGPPGP